MPRRHRSRSAQYYQYDLDLSKVSEVWRRGSVISSLAARPHRRRAPRRPAARRVLGRGQRLRRGSLDDQRRHRRGRAGAGAVGRAVRTLLVARPGRRGRQGAVRHARRLRRAPRTNGVDTMNSVHIDSARSTPTSPTADALVLFGATGDLAKRKLFPALYQLERRGELTGPGDRRGAQRLDRRRLPHARRGVDPGAHRRRRPGGDRRAVQSGSTSCRATTPTERRGRRWPTTLDKLESKVAVFYMAIPPTMFPTVAQTLASVGPAPTGADRGREAVRPRPRVGASS